MRRSNGAIDCTEAELIVQSNALRKLIGQRNTILHDCSCMMKSRDDAAERESVCVLIINNHIIYVYNFV